MLKQGVCNDQCSGLLDSPKEREMNVTIRVRLCSQPARQDKMCAAIVWITTDVVQV